MSEELKKLEYDINNLKSHKKNITENDHKENNVYSNKKISMDIPEEIKTEGIDENIEKLRKKNITTTENNEINKIKGFNCTENCIIV